MNNQKGDAPRREYKVVELKEGTFEVILEEGTTRLSWPFESRPAAERFIEKKQREAKEGAFK